MSDSIFYHKIDDPDFKCSFISLVELLLINGTYSSTKVKKIIVYNAKIEKESIKCDVARPAIKSQ